MTPHEFRYGGSYRDSLSELSKRVAAIELVPCHSVSFRDYAALRRLQSTICAREFVREHVVPRAEDGKAVVVLMHGARRWELQTTSEGVVACSGQNITLSKKSRAGKAVLRYLGIDAEDA